MLLQLKEPTQNALCIYAVEADGKNNLTAALVIFKFRDAAEHWNALRKKYNNTPGDTFLKKKKKCIKVKELTKFNVIKVLREICFQ